MRNQFLAALLTILLYSGHFAVGYYYKAEDFHLKAATTLSGTTNANSGISIVVPAEQLKQLLESPELQRQRDSDAASRGATGLP